MSHWYDRSGSSRYEVEGKNGSLRPSTLRDARKFGWVPSVSTVWSDVIAKPMLNKWIQTELLKEFHLQVKERGGSGVTLGFDDLESLTRSQFNASQQKVMKRGTDIHNYLEMFFKKEGSIPTQILPLCEAVAYKLSEVCGDQDWEVEKSFAHPSGYGGKTDMCSDEWVIDFKTKEFPDNPNVKKMVYDDHAVQLAAYDQGLVNTLTTPRRLLNLFIDVKDANAPRVLEWEHEDTDRYRQMFNSALSLWKLSKKYNPEWHIL